MSLAYKISVLAARHAELQTELAALEYAPGALESAQTYVRDIQATIPREEKRLKSTEWSMKNQRGEYNDMKFSVFRKFGYRATGQAAKWDGEAAKKERVFLDAEEQWNKDKEALAALKISASEAEQHVRELQGLVSRRERLERELEDMYKHIFDGPTPEAPQEDALEWAAQRAEDENNRAQSALTQETDAMTQLTSARTTLQQCEAKMKECVHASKADMWGAGGRTADILEHSALAAAQTLSTQFLAQWGTARQRQANANGAGVIGNAPTVTLPRANMTEVLFDNVFSDMSQHEKILKGLESVRAALKSTDAEIVRAQERVELASANAQVVAEDMTNARDALRTFRRTTFEELATRGAPPGYDQQEADAGLTSVPSSGPPPT